MRRPNRLLILLALLCVAGCQCCALTEPYLDLVDRVSDHEGHADRFYHPGFDLTRIGRSDWPWCWCRRGPRIPIVVYNTPVTDQVFARERAREDGGESLEPPPAPAEQEQFEPDLDPTMKSVPDAPAPNGPMLEASPEPPALRPPPPPAPMPSDRPVQDAAGMTDRSDMTDRRTVPPKASLKQANRIDRASRKELSNPGTSDSVIDSGTDRTVRQVGLEPDETSPPPAEPRS